MKNSIILLIAVLLSACTTLNQSPSQQNPSDTETTVELGSPQEQPRAGEAVVEDKTLISPEKKDGEPFIIKKISDIPTTVTPTSAMSGDLLFQILTGELAYQRGQPRFAYETIIDAAEKTGDARLAQRAAEMAIKSNPREALNAVRLWHQLAPHSKDAERYFLIFLIIENRLDEAGVVMSNRLQMAQPNERAILMSQFQQFLSGASDRAQAFKVLETILIPYMDTAEAHTTLAFSAYVNKDNVRSVDEAGKALALKPDSELAVLMLVQAVSNPQEAVDVLSSFLQKYPDSREVRITYARLLISMREHAKAAAEFQYLHAAQPDDLMFVYSLALLSLQQNDPKSAEKYLKQYIEIATAKKTEDSNISRVLFLLAQIAEERNDHDTALKWLGMIDSDSERDAWLLARIKSAQIMARKGDLPKARAELAAQRRDNPGDYEPLVTAEAQILRGVNQYQEAFELLKIATQDHPESTSILYDFALTAEKVDQMAEMENALRRIIELDPANQQAYNALGYSFADRNIHLDEAYELIDKALQLAPNDAYIIDSMGWILFRQGKLEKAEEMLRLSYGFQKDVEITVHLAEVLWIRGKQEEALQLLKEVQQKEPKNELLTSTLKRLGVALP